MEIFNGLNVPKFLKTTSESTIQDYFRSLQNFLQEMLFKARGFQESYYLKITKEGGIAIRLTAGETIVKGNVLRTSVTTDNQVLLVDANGDMPIGVAYDGALQNQDVWVVVSGIAEVLFKGGVTGTRGYISYVSSTAGHADNAPTVPATTVHFREIGHVLETGTSGGLAKLVLHFN